MKARDWLLLVIVIFCVATGIVLLLRRTDTTPPDNPVRPVLPHIPDIAGKMSGAKSVCEDTARSAQARARESRNVRRQLPKGRDLYRDTRAAYNDCITDICISADRFFMQDDLPRIVRKLEDASQRMGSFLTWYNDLGGRKWAGEGDLLAPVLGFFRQLMNDTDDARRKSIASLKAGLEKCRLKSWDDLGK